MAKKKKNVIRRTVSVINGLRNVERYREYLEQHGMQRIESEPIDKGRRTQFSFDYEVPEPAVAEPADLGLDDGNDFGDGGPTREDITGKNPNSNEDRASAGLPARKSVTSDAALSGGSGTKRRKSSSAPQSLSGREYV